jgi:exonuclease SbcD
LREAIRHLQATFEPFLRGGGTILAVTGNHDNENFCQTLRHAMTLAAPSVGEFGGVAPPGRLYLAAEPSLLRLHDPQTGRDAQFVLMPYPTPSRFLTNDVLQRYGSFDQKNQFLQAAFAGRLADIRADARFDARLLTVLVAHVNVRGAEAAPLFRISETDDIVIEDRSLHANYAYVALGHIHRAQAVDGHEHVRYCGSIDRMDIDERDYRHGVVLVELNDTGLARPPVTLPLDASPIYEVEIHDPMTELPTLPDRYPDHASALVNLHVQYTAGVDSLEEVLRELDVLFPRWYCRDWTERGAIGPPLTIGAATATKGFEDTVRDYLATELQNYSDEERAAVLELANELVKELT